MTCGSELVLRQRPKGKAVDMPLHDGIEAAEICALLPEEVRAMA